MIAVPAHELTITRFCKVAGCEEQAIDKRGPYGLLCEGHKQAKKAELVQQRDGQRIVRQQATEGLVDATRALHSQAKRCARAARQLDEERAQLRAIYLQVGVEAGFLTRNQG